MYAISGTMTLLCIILLVRTVTMWNFGRITQITLMLIAGNVFNILASYFYYQLAILYELAFKEEFSPPLFKISDTTKNKIELY